MIVNADILEWCKTYEGPKFTAAFCDPPYEIGFMSTGNGHWDSTGISFNPATWKAIAQHLYPGAYLLAFGGTRTVHRIAVAIEDAGFEIRDTVMWVYGSGFPKSHDVSKAIAKDTGIGLCTCAVSEPCYNGGYENDIQRGGSEDVGDVYGQGVSGESGSERTTSDAMEAKGRSANFQKHLQGSEADTLLKLPKEDNSQEQGVLAVKEPILQPNVREPVYEKAGLGDTPIRSRMETSTGGGESDASSMSGVPNSEKRDTASSSSCPVQVRGKEHDTKSSSTLPVMPQQGGTRDGSDFRKDKDSHNTGEDDANSKYLCAKCGKVRKGLGGTALKPSWEPVIVARLPLENTVAKNLQKYGSGVLNIDGSRVGTTKDVPASPKKVAPSEHTVSMPGGKMSDDGFNPNIGRWPANLIHDGSPEVVGMFPNTGNNWRKSKGQGDGAGMFGVSGGDTQGQDDSGSASRFFKSCPLDDPDGTEADIKRLYYSAKVSKRERDAGLEGFEEKELNALGNFEGTPEHGPKLNVRTRNNHPTLKPLSLTKYLATLILPPKLGDGHQPRRLLVPFSGAGSEVIGALQSGWDEVVGVEQSKEYCEISEARIKHWTKEPAQKEML